MTYQHVCSKSLCLNVKVGFHVDFCNMPMCYDTVNFPFGYVYSNLPFHCIGKRIILTVMGPVLVLIRYRYTSF